MTYIVPTCNKMFQDYAMKLMAKSAMYRAISHGIKVFYRSDNVHRTTKRYPGYFRSCTAFLSSSKLAVLSHIQSLIFKHTRFHPLRVKIWSKKKCIISKIFRQKWHHCLVPRYRFIMKQCTLMNFSRINELIYNDNYVSRRRNYFLLLEIKNGEYRISAYREVFSNEN